MGKNSPRRTWLLGAAALLLFIPADAQLGQKIDTTGQLRSNPSPRRARFRVTLNGFFVNRQTVDHVLQVDGKGDEVYCVADVLLYNRAGELLLRRRHQSAVLGDTAGFPQRLRAGSAGDSGGLKSGDAYPHAEPWRRRADTLLRDEVGARRAADGPVGGRVGRRREPRPDHADDLGMGRQPRTLRAVESGVGKGFAAET